MTPAAGESSSTWHRIGYWLGERPLVVDVVNRRDQLHVGDHQSARGGEGVAPDGFDDQAGGGVRQLALHVVERRVNVVVADIKSDIELGVLERGRGKSRLEPSGKISVGVADG